MATELAKLTVIDPENVRESLASGGAIVSRYGTGLIQLTFLSIRHDAQAQIDGRQNVMPMLVVTGRFIIENEAGMHLAEQLRDVIVNSKRIGRPMIPDGDMGKAN